MKLHLREDYSPHPRRWWHIPLLLILILGTIYIAREYNGTENKETSWKASETKMNEGAVFGTFYHLTYRSATDRQSAIDSVLADVDHSLSPFNKKSIITAINENRSMQTDARLRHVFTLARRVYEATGGAFDISVAPLVNAWGFGFKEGRNPSDAEIDSLRQFVGLDKVRLEATPSGGGMEGAFIMKADPRLMLDCSAIAKGYGVDAVADNLEAQGIRDYLVEIGGEIRVNGLNPQGQPWHIGIIRPVDDPLANNNDIQQVMEVSNTAIATSGNYRNYYEQDGQKVAHTIDPRTGHPVQRDILSATVLAPDCATADAFATAFMVVGLDEAKQILEKHPELQAYFICADGQGKAFTWHTDRLNIPEN